MFREKNVPFGYFKPVFVNEQSETQRLFLYPTDNYNCYEKHIGRIGYIWRFEDIILIWGKFSGQKRG